MKAKNSKAVTKADLKKTMAKDKKDDMKMINSAMKAKMKKKKQCKDLNFAEESKELDN